MTGITYAGLITPNPIQTTIARDGKPILYAEFEFAVDVPIPRHFLARYQFNTHEQASFYDIDRWNLVGLLYISRKEELKERSITPRSIQRLNSQINPLSVDDLFWTTVLQPFSR